MTFYTPNSLRFVTLSQALESVTKRCVGVAADFQNWWGVVGSALHIHGESPHLVHPSCRVVCVSFVNHNRVSCFPQFEPITRLTFLSQVFVYYTGMLSLETQSFDPRCLEAKTVPSDREFWPLWTETIAKLDEDIIVVGAKEMTRLAKEAQYSNPTSKLVAR